MTEAALALSAAWLAALAFLQGAPTRLSPIRNTVSEYGLGPFAWAYRAQAAFAAGAAACLAGAHVETVLLSVLAAARAGLAAAPIDRRPEVHAALAAVAFTCACWAAFGAGGEPVLGWLATAGAVGTVASLRARGMLGLWQRLFFAAAIAWSFLVAARLS